MFRNFIEPYVFRFITPLRQQKRINLIRKKCKAVLVFLVSSLSMWRNQALFDRLRRDVRFDPVIVLFPFSGYSQDLRQNSIQELKSYFDGISVPYLDLSNESNPGQILRELIDPDLIFYPQPYNDLFGNDLDSNYFNERLLCYSPYALQIIEGDWVYKSMLLNSAWRIFFEADFRLTYARRLLYNKGRNVRICGDSMADVFSEAPQRDVWKTQPKKKKVIWAPHFTIQDTSHFVRNSFLWLNDFMLVLAARYQNQIQFAFKPHPRLLSELYSHPDWGKEKADAYYLKWASGNNTQLETGSYVDLFKESDAMIHDSVSFSAEYHYTGNPVMFTSHNPASLTAGLTVLGEQAILAHYQGTTEDEIESFLNNVVIEGNDPMKQLRNDFRAKYLTPPDSGNVAENIYQELVKSIWS